MAKEGDKYFKTKKRDYYAPAPPKAKNQPKMETVKEEPVAETIDESTIETIECPGHEGPAMRRRHAP